MRVPPALLALALLAGCLGQPAADPSATYGFEGVFMPAVSDAELLEFGDRVRAEGGELTVVEKTPPTFAAWGLTRKGCEVVHDFAATMLFIIASMGDCEPAAITTNEPALVAAAAPVVPEGPVLASAPVAGESW